MYEAASVTAMLYLILMAAPIFTYFINWRMFRTRWCGGSTAIGFRRSE